MRPDKRSRALDWGCALMILGWGLALLAPGETLLSSPAYGDLLARAPEETWGWICTGLGVVHAVALIVNGSLDEGSPIIRAVVAALAVVVWGQFAFAFAATSEAMGVMSLGVPAALVPAALDLFCALRAGADAIHARRARVDR